MPDGSVAPVPTASFSAGMPNSITPPRPSSAASATALSRLARVCWTTPGIDPIGRGSSRSSRTNSGSTSCRGSTDVSATSRRIAGVVRSRRGRTSGRLTESLGLAHRELEPVARRLVRLAALERSDGLVTG